MKKVLSILLCAALVFGVGVSVPQAESEECESEEPQEIVETEEIKYLTDSELSKLYTCKEDIRISDDTIVELSFSDALLLMDLAVAETGDEGAEAQYLVMMVVINRLRDERFPNTISEIIMQDGQFAVVDNGALKKAVPNVDSHLALAMVEQGIDKSEGAIYFEASTNSCDSWHCKNKTFLYEKYGQRYYK